MSGLIVPGASGQGKAQAPPPPGLTMHIDPNGFQDKFCPYQSGVWGGAAVIQELVGAQTLVQNVVTPHGHTYVRCHSACVHFDADLKKTHKTPCRVDAACAAQAESLSLLRELAESQRSAQRLLKLAQQHFPDMSEGLEAVQKIEAQGGPA